MAIAEAAKPRAVPADSALAEQLRAFESEVEGWLGALAKPGVKGSHAVGMLTMAFGTFEELLRQGLFRIMQKHNVGDEDVATAAGVGRKPLEKQPLGKIIACLRAVRTLRPATAQIITDARLATLDKLAFTRNQRLKMPHSSARRAEILALAPDALREIRTATKTVLVALLTTAVPGRG